MKNRLLRLWAVSLLLALVFTLSACSASAEKLEQKLGVSFDNIVCQYSYGAMWSYDVYDGYATNITIYADNTVRLWTSASRADSEPLAECTARITEEQKQALVDAIRKNNLFALSDCSNYSVMDGSWRYITFYDADGSEVHQCGGSNPSNRRFHAVLRLIREYFPGSGELLEGLEDETLFNVTVNRLFDKLLEYHDDPFLREMSCAKRVFSFRLGYYTVPHDESGHEISYEEVYTLLPDSKLIAGVMAYGNIGENEYVVKEVSETYDLKQYQLYKLINIFTEHCKSGYLEFADYYSSLPLWPMLEDTERYGTITLYDEEGQPSNIFYPQSEEYSPDFSTELTIALEKEIYRLFPDIPISELRDTAVSLVAAELPAAVEPVDLVE